MLKVTAFLFFCLVATALAQDFPGAYDPNAYVQSKCEAYAGLPNSCDDFVNPNIWVPTNTSQSIIQQQIADYATIDDILAAVPSPECKALFLKTLCGSAFRQCQFNNVSLNATTYVDFVFGKPVCKSVCVDTVNSCRQYFEAAGYSQYLPNCSYEVSGYPVYPDVSIDVTVYNQTVSLTCFIPPGPDGLCIDAGLFTVCAGSTISSPFSYVMPFFETTLFEMANSFSSWLSALL